jgi:hypothetical protein
VRPSLETNPAKVFHNCDPYVKSYEGAVRAKKPIRKGKSSLWVCYSNPKLIN